MHRKVKVKKVNKSKRESTREFKVVKARAIGDHSEITQRPQRDHKESTQRVFREQSEN